MVRSRDSNTIVGSDGKEKKRMCRRSAKQLENVKVVFSLEKAEFPNDEGSLPS